MTRPVSRRQRRHLLERGALAGLWACGAFWPGAKALAGTGDAAFDASSFNETLDRLGARPVVDGRIEISVADVNENGAVVPVSVTSHLPDTREIAIVAEANPSPLVIRFAIPEGTDAFVSMRMKMARSSRIFAVVRAGDQSYLAFRDTVVMVGGCG